MTARGEDFDLAASWRELYRARFRDAVQTGDLMPFVLPFHLLAVWIVPTLYLAIPHRDRPWLYRARWLVLAFIVAFNFKMVTGVSSLNFASAYGVRPLVLCSVFGGFLLLKGGGETAPKFCAISSNVSQRVQCVSSTSLFVIFNPRALGSSPWRMMCLFIWP